MPILTIGSNRKLGKKVGSFSRPVGPSCPSDCPFLTGQLRDGTPIPKGERCYADSLQKQYTSVRVAWSTKAWGMEPTQWQAWSAQLAMELISVKAVAHRIHVGGDFLNNGTLDVDYVEALIAAVRIAREKGATVPMWYYTHAWEVMAPYRTRLLELGVHGFASVHTEDEARDAQALGWTRLAIDPGEHKKQATAGFHEIYTVRSLQCPEQLGKTDCSKCGYCFKDGGNRSHVTFSRH